MCITGQRVLLAITSLAPLVFLLRKQCRRSKGDKVNNMGENYCLWGRGLLGGGAGGQEKGNGGPGRESGGLGG